LIECLRADKLREALARTNTVPMVTACSFFKKPGSKPRRLENLPAPTVRFDADDHMIERFDLASVCLR
jgi:hypothetical protein